MNQKIIQFDSIEGLKETLDKKIKDMDSKIEVHSKIIGDKIRQGEKENSGELSDLKEKLNPQKTKDVKPDKKNSKNKKVAPKKKKSKKDNLDNWINYERLHLYNGVGTRGEIELYFKSLEEMRSDLEQLRGTSESVEKLMNSGIKKDLAGVGYFQDDGTFEVAFIKTDLKREKFSFKSILTVGCEC